MTLRITHAPANRGIAWLREGFAVFFQRPMGFSLMFMLFLAAALVLMALPGIGAVLLLAVMPLLTLGFAAGARAARAGRPVHAGLLFEPFRGGADTKRRNALLRLCLAYAFAMALVMVLSQTVDGGSFERLQVLMAAERTEDNQKLIDEVLADPRLRSGMFVRVLLIGALSVPFWHAPMLVSWHGQGLAQSLFSSTLACWRNKGAFATYLLGWVGISAAFGLLASAVVALLGTPQLAAVALPPAALVFSVVFYASLYFVYADSFATESDIDSPPAIE
jgi:hypothetical protein